LAAIVLVGISAAEWFLNENQIILFDLAQVQSKSDVVRQFPYCNAMWRLLWRAEYVQQLGGMDFGSKTKPIVPTDCKLKSHESSAAIAEQVIIPFFLWHSWQCSRFLEFMVGEQNISWRSWILALRGKCLFSHCEASLVHFLNSVPVCFHRKQSRVDPRFHCRRLANIGSDKIYWEDGSGIEIEWSRDGSIDSEPWTPGSVHFIQLPLHYAQLSLEGAILEATNNGSYDSSESYNHRRASRSTAKTILGIFFFVFGAALLKLAFYYGDTPRP